MRAWGVWVSDLLLKNCDPWWWAMPYGAIFWTNNIAVAEAQVERLDKEFNVEKKQFVFEIKEFQ